MLAELRVEIIRLRGFAGKEVSQVTKLSECRTEQNVLKAFQTESQLREEYASFAEIAEREGKMQLAKIFRASSASEDIIARMFLRSLHETAHGTSELWAAGLFDTKKVKDSSKENLATALNEARGVMSMYPQMIKDAEKEGAIWDLAREFFSYAESVEKAHATIFEKALESFDALSDVDYYVCESCGNTVEKSPSETCQICKSKKSAFKVVH